MSAGQVVDHDGRDVLGRRTRGPHARRCTRHRRSPTRSSGSFARLDAADSLRQPETWRVGAATVSARPPGSLPVGCNTSSERYGFRSGPRPGEERLDPVESGLGRLLHAAEALPPDAVSLLVADELVAHAGRARRDGRAGVDAAAAVRWSPAGSTAGSRRPGARGAPVGARLVPAVATAIVAQPDRRRGRAAASAWRDQLRPWPTRRGPGAEQTPDQLVAAFADQRIAGSRAADRPGPAACGPVGHARARAAAAAAVGVGPDGTAPAARPSNGRSADRVLNRIRTLAGQGGGDRVRG